ncbi:Detected protein of unknown function [Hibiscus syriacus]|uniref:Uncharacterized protein n=1 Tax=Hibiscus syriacus TaxID=106335 RepID=A0A6A2YPS4_HIBSY|nr:Detected protein of unknown function [Hibiscus syriacus]
MSPISFCALLISNGPVIVPFPDQDIPSMPISIHHSYIEHSTTPQQPCKEKFSEWPHGLLAIETFGNKIKQEPEKPNPQQDIHVNHLHGLTPEEVGKLQKEFNLIFQEHVEPPPTSLVHSRWKDVSLDNSKAAIGKKSLLFLLKKMFVCINGFSPAPISLRDPALESRMEKMLKTILHKKIYPQNHGNKLTTKKSLESSAHIARTINGDDKTEKADDGSKWVKTDSKYIVLEI